MLWHVVSLDAAHLDETARVKLEVAIDKLREIDDIHWFQWGRDVERPGTTAIIAVLVDLDALERYRVHPVHLDLVQAIRESGATVHRLDLDHLPLPS